MLTANEYNEQKKNEKWKMITFKRRLLVYSLWFVCLCETLALRHDALLRFHHKKIRKMWASCRLFCHAFVQPIFRWLNAMCCWCDRWIVVFAFLPGIVCNWHMSNSVLRIMVTDIEMEIRYLKKSNHKCLTFFTHVLHAMFLIKSIRLGGFCWMTKIWWISWWKIFQIRLTGKRLDE